MRPRYDPYITSKECEGTPKTHGAVDNFEGVLRNLIDPKINLKEGQRGPEASWTLLRSPW